MDARKVKSIQEWVVPTWVRDVQSFLGFANFYRRLIKRFSLSQMKSVCFIWWLTPPTNSWPQKSTTPYMTRSFWLLLLLLKNGNPILSGRNTVPKWLPTDHKNLVSFSTTRTLNCRQARWSTVLADYDFEMIFWLGAQHMTTDVLSCRSEFDLTPEDEAYVQQSQSLLKPN